ncbi:PilZ domain-containing protein [Alteraurantiacibacter aquimixticola]|uniref:PilZ domain-containing protein n=1 Tax=Alteraurantiacibacter aquimixticola TaxID=2489173 RepID=A0A4T3F375_9SPHN|nr:PilZ domain-containing protein [Alteraurantiacibacter aquimixticola]TIX49090.1 PilZ domain-containing protein [Alteraurantiacibacter aquimixticola]
MHRLRKALSEGTVPVLEDPTATKDVARRQGNGTLCGTTIHRAVRRQYHQRNEERYPTEDLTATASWRRETSELRVINLSSNGLQVETGRQAEIGEAIEVALGECDPVESSVRWIKDDRIGLEFTAETRLLTEAGVVEYVLENISEILSSSGEPVDRRVGVERRGRAMRHGLAWLGAFTAKGETAAVLLRNISQTGAMLHLDDPIELAKGDACTLDLGEAGMLSATVKWSAGEEIGVKFDEEFDIAQLVNHAAADVGLLTGEEEEAVVDPRSAYAPTIDQVLQKKPWQSSGQPCRRDVTPDGAGDDGEARIGPPSLRELYDTMYPNGRPDASPLGEQPGSLEA